MVNLPLVVMKYTTRKGGIEMKSPKLDRAEEVFGFKKMHCLLL